MEYEDHCDILHSKCYTEYGLKRTGCPYGFELNVIQKLYKAVMNIFGESYRKYKEFCKKMDELC